MATACRWQRALFGFAATRCARPTKPRPNAVPLSSHPLLGPSSPLPKVGSCGCGLRVAASLHWDARAAGAAGDAWDTGAAGTLGAAGDARRRKRARRRGALSETRARSETRGAVGDAPPQSHGGAPRRVPRTGPVLSVRLRAPAAAKSKERREARKCQQTGANPCFPTGTWRSGEFQASCHKVASSKPIGPILRAEIESTLAARAAKEIDHAKMHLPKCLSKHANALPSTEKPRDPTKITFLKK